jgi:hypothetical protein
MAIVSKAAIIHCAVKTKLCSKNETYYRYPVLKKERRGFAG